MRDNDRIIQETEEHFANEKMDFNKSFSNCEVKEYDKVELLVEKAKYAIEGVYKGANGCVPFPYVIDGKRGILFYDICENKDREVELDVDREDFKIIE